MKDILVVYNICGISNREYLDDYTNSIKSLNAGGIVFLHDLLPRCEMEQKIPQSYNSWTGDVCKVALELSRSSNVDLFLVNSLLNSVSFCK